MERREASDLPKLPRPFEDLRTAVVYHEDYDALFVLERTPFMHKTLVYSGAHLEGYEVDLPFAETVLNTLMDPRAHIIGELF